MDNLGSKTLIVVWIFMALSMVVVGLRLLSRIKYARAYDWDDSIMVVALLVNLAADCSYTVTCTQGAGAHISSLPPDQVAQVTRLELVTTTFMQNSFTWPKLSLAMTLGKIFSPVRSLKVTLILLAGVLCLFGIALAIATWLQCAPVRRDWDKAVAGTCWNAHVLAGLEIGLSSYSAFLDVMFAFWPMRLVWHLQTDKKRKILLEILLGLTLFPLIVAILKTYELARIRSHNDITYDYTWIDMINQVETSCIMIAASIPTIAPLVKALWPKFTLWLTPKTSQQLTTDFGMPRDRSDTNTEDAIELLARSPRISQKSTESGSKPGSVVGLATPAAIRPHSE